MELLVIIKIGWKPSTIIAKCSTLDALVVLYATPWIWFHDGNIIAGGAYKWRKYLYDINCSKAICKSYRKKKVNESNNKSFWNEKRTNRVKLLPLLTRVSSKSRYWTLNTLLSLTIGEGIPLVTLNYNKGPKTTEKNFFWIFIWHNFNSKSNQKFQIEKILLVEGKTE